jgi:hypothetical protein
MRKLVLTALLLVFVGAVAAAWLSSSTPSGSAIGDITLAESRIPGSGLNGFGVPPRQDRTTPGRSSYFAGGSAASTPDSGPDTIASSSLPQAYDAPTAIRRSTSSRARQSFAARTQRGNRSSSGGGGFSSSGSGSGGVGGGGGGVSRAPQDTAQAQGPTTFTTESTDAPEVTQTPSAPAPRRPSSRRSGGGGSGGGGGTINPPVAAAPAPAVVAAPAPALAPAPVVVAAPSSPAASPSASPTPEPTTMLLLGTGIAGLYRMRRHLE